MATFEIPAEPDAERVWLLDHSWPCGPMPVVRVSERWEIRHDDAPARPRYSWSRLLELGTVTDVDPDDVSWLPDGPWRAVGIEVTDANGGDVLRVAADALFNLDDDACLAALIVRIVNEHVARHGKS